MELIPVDGMPMPMRMWAVLTLAAGVFLTGLDASIANVALPTIAHQLRISAVDAIWIANAYQLGLIAILLPSSALGEIIGYRRLFLSGLALFTLASAGCALAPNWTVLVASRVLQGMGAAGAIGVANAILRYIFPRKMLGRGFGIYAMIAASSSAVGPTAGSAVLAVLDWHWLFWLSVPLGLAVMAVGTRTLPISDRVSRPFDFAGALLTVFTFAMFMLGLDGIAHSNSAWLVASEFAGALAAAVYLVRLEGRLTNPLLPLDLMRIPMFKLSIAVSLTLYSTQFLAYVSLPFYFSDTLGLSQATTGLLMTPWPLIFAMTAPLSGTLADRCSAAVMCGVGLLITSGGLLLVSRMPPQPRIVDILWRMIVCGVGWALVIAPNSRALMVSAPKSRAGAAGGMTAITRNLGQSLGTALTAMIFGHFSSDGAVVCLELGAVFALSAAVLSFRRQQI